MTGQSHRSLLQTLCMLGREALDSMPGMPGASGDYLITLYYVLPVVQYGTPVG